MRGAEVWRWEGGGFVRGEFLRGERESAERLGLVADGNSLLILPPLWDHHGHVGWLGALGEEVDLRGTASREEALSRIRSAAGATAPAEWLVGFGWDQNLWEGAGPDLPSLDAACGSRPAYFRRIDTHAAWVNAAALGALGIPTDASDPPGGVFVRSGGAFAGLLLDRAMEPFERHLSARAAILASHRILRGLNELRAAGLSGTTDMNLDGPSLEALTQLSADGALPIPVDGFLSPGLEGEMTVVPGGQAFRVAGRKIFMDGALGSRGAALLEGYADDPSNFGLLAETGERVRGHIEEARKRKWTLAAHAIGDRALRVFLEAAEAGGGCASLRLEHLQVVCEEDLPRLAAISPVASLQPCHRLSDASWAPLRLGGRMAGAYRLATLKAACGGLLLGTDFPIERPDPRRTLCACLSGPAQERIALGEALGGMAPPPGRANPGAFTLALGEPWVEGLAPERVLSWKMHAAEAPAGGGP